MMFLGTESYPDEQAFKEFITRHGGSSNAFTGMETTGYHFGVNALQLAPALHRFASFFREPLLREDSARREMKAVHSEFQRNLQSDQRRLFQLIKSTSDQKHPFHKFSTVRAKGRAWRV
jgi:insulysin